MADRQGGNRQDFADRKYRPLKKSMKKTYKDMVKLVEQGQLPSGAIVTDFMAQVRTMVSYPGFGDDHYKTFTIACDSLHKAFKSKDSELFAIELKKISLHKKECHHRYK